MNSQDYRNLQEAYLDVYAPQEEVEQINELSVNKMNAYINKAEKDRGRLNKKWDQGTATSKERKKVFDREEGEARASKKIRQKTGKDSFRLNALDKLKSAITKESYDLYDIILSHLLDEGYADTQEAAEAIMVNMSEEWRESIFEEVEQLDELSDKLVSAARNKLAKRTDRSIGGDSYSQNVNRETRMNDKIQARNKRTGSNVEPTFTRRHQ